MLVSFTRDMERRILFVGDSLTCYRGGWQQQFSRMRHESFDNISKGGKRTKWMLKQLEGYQSETERYNEVVIYGGINDSFSSVREDETIQNIQRMVYIARKMGAEAIVVIGYNPEKVIKNTIYSDEVETRCRKRYISLQKRMQAELKWCTIIPMDDTVDRSDSDDGIHLRASGHKKFSKHVMNALSL